MIGKFKEAQIKEKAHNPPRWSSVTYTFFLLFLLTAPLNVYGLGSGAFNFRFSRIFLVLSVISIVFDYMIRRRSVHIGLQHFDYLLFFYCWLALISGLYVENYSAFFTRFFGLLECMLILYVVRLVTYENGRFRKSVRFYLLSSIFVILAAFYQLYSLWYNPEGLALPFRSLLLTERYETLTELEHFGGSLGGVLRTSSTFGEPNMMAGYCSSIIPFSIVMFLTASEKREKILAFLYAILGIGIAVTMISAVSKSGILTTVTAIMTFIFLVFKGMSVRERHKIALLLTIILLGLAVYGFYAKDFLLLRFGLLDSGHIEYRIETLRDLVEGSLFGTGYGNYKNISAHTLILTASLELGLLGGFVVFFLSVQPIGYLHLRRNLLLASRTDQVARMHYYFYSAAFAAYFSIFVGLYLYDYWLHPFTWVGIGFHLSIISRIQDGFHRFFKDL